MSRPCLDQPETPSPAQLDLDRLWSYLLHLNEICDTLVPDSGCSMEDLRTRVKQVYKQKCSDGTLSGFPPLLGAGLQSASQAALSLHEPQTVVVVKEEPPRPSLIWPQKFLFLYREREHHTSAFSFKYGGWEAGAVCIFRPLEGRLSQHHEFVSDSGESGLFHRTLNVLEHGQNSSIEDASIRVYSLVRWTFLGHDKPFQNKLGLEARLVVVEKHGERPADAFSFEKWNQKKKLAEILKVSAADSSVGAAGSKKASIQTCRDTDGLAAKDTLDNSIMIDKAQTSVQSAAQSVARFRAVMRPTDVDLTNKLRPQGGGTESSISFLNTPSPNPADYGRTDFHKLVWLAAKVDPNTRKDDFEELCRKAKLLLADGADANKPKDNGSTPLHEAAFHGNLPLVRFLLEEGDVAASLKQATKGGFFPLHHASYAASKADNGKQIFALLWARSPLVARRPLREGPVLLKCDCAALDSEFASPCAKEGECWNRSILEALCQDPSQQFLRLVHDGKLAEVAEMLQTNPERVHARNWKNGKTALDYAAACADDIAEQMRQLVLPSSSSGLDSERSADEVCFEGRTAPQMSAFNSNSEEDRRLTTGERDDGPAEDPAEEIERLRKILQEADSFFADEARPSDPSSDPCGARLAASTEPSAACGRRRAAADEDDLAGMSGGRGGHVRGKRSKRAHTRTHHDRHEDDLAGMSGGRGGHVRGKRSKRAHTRTHHDRQSVAGEGVEAEAGGVAGGDQERL